MNLISDDIELDYKHYNDRVSCTKRKGRFPEVQSDLVGHEVKVSQLSGYNEVHLDEVQGFSVVEDIHPKKGKAKQTLTKSKLTKVHNIEAKRNKGQCIKGNQKHF